MSESNPGLSRRQIMTGTAGVAAATLAASGATAQETATGPFAGKTGFVTGAARGTGLACAEELAKGGANVVMFDIAEQPLSGGHRRRFGGSESHD